VDVYSGLTREQALELAPIAHGVDAHLCSAEFLSVAPELRWVQAWSAGVDRYVDMPGLAEHPRLVLTNMRGVHGPAIAEHVFASLLSLTRGLSQWRDAQRQRDWDRNLAPEMTSLAGRTMLVVGMGGIGREIASRAHAFDMHVLATVRTAREAPAYVDELGVSADLERFLPRADVVAIALPLTPETRGLFDARRLALCKPGAYVVNIARGPIVDTDALLAALESGALAGACLDVTDPEPLNADHPLWAREDVVITPHVAGRAEITGDRRWATFRAQMERFARGEPLENVVDFAIGY
jgi:phosphoglycerate dehydrogenase-like enzyme